MRKFFEIIGICAIICIFAMGVWGFITENPESTFNYSEDSTKAKPDTTIITLEVRVDEYGNKAYYIDNEFNGWISYTEVDTPTTLSYSHYFPVEYLMNQGEMHILQDTFTTTPDTVVFVDPDDYIIIDQKQHKRLTGAIAIKNVSEFNVLLYSNDSDNWTRIYPNGGSDSWSPAFEDSLFFKSISGSVPTEIIYFLPRWTGK